MFLALHSGIYKDENGTSFLPEEPVLEGCVGRLCSSNSLLLEETVKKKKKKISEQCGKSSDKCHEENFLRRNDQLLLREHLEEGFLWNRCWILTLKSELIYQMGRWR